MDSVHTTAVANGPTSLSRGDDQRWCCVQSGHREKYAIPRALHHAGALGRLVTDVWVPPGSPMAALAPGRLGRRLQDRFDAGIPAEKIAHCSWRSLAWEMTARARRLTASQQVLAHNRWWGATATRALERDTGCGLTHVFSYCYATRSLFAAAHRRGLVTVLGQIDPGPVEDARVAEIVRRWPEYRSTFQPCAEDYYDDWREECRLAGHIVVNSEWSRTALLRAGIEERKIVVCPLVYVAPVEARDWQKSYPMEFTRDRPLRVLFLGQCILRKGIAEALEAARSLMNRPVEFTLVGNTDIENLTDHFKGARVRYIPRVSRAECHAFYREADVFLFPTHSDGFGLTQLEAQSWKLPIIASSFCATVVRPHETGWILSEVSGRAIARVLESILVAPTLLSRFSHSIRPWDFGMEQLADRLLAMNAGREGQHS